MGRMRNDWSGQRLPHPPGRRRLLGDLLRDADPRTPVQNILTVAPGLGPIFEFKAFGNRFVLVQSAELTGELCDESRFHKALAPGVEALRIFVRDGLFTAYDDEPNWRLAHDLLQPAFTKAAMRGYHDAMNAVADELVDKWDEAARPVDVSSDLTRLTLETIGRTSFSHSFGAFTTEEQDPFVASMVRTLRLAQRRAALLSIPGARVLKPLSDRRAHREQATVSGIVDGIIGDRLTSGDTSTGDILGLMLHSAHPETGEHLDRLNIRRQIFTFLVAGHETTSGALSFAMYYLATNPRVRARAQAEADAILGPDPNARPTYEQIPHLRYIRRVLDEGLRLWPTAPGFARAPLAPTTVGGHRMTPDDWALVVLPLVHRDPAVWGPDADVFDPDNFLPERIRSRPAHAYKPFGTGERSCIGRQFALHEAVLVLARLLHRYDFEADPAYALTISERLTLMPTGFRLEPTRRVPAGAGRPASA
jgi:unspecific monooxygenase